uniref:Replication protein n=1 Tax=Parvoviridae sp. TaxID=1940570 RepID=A0A7D3UW97_9VIRU|nr:MAG: replication protein [Parvoviridae sp.]
MEFQQRPKSVSFNHEDRQWDCRFNVQTDADLDELLAAIKSEDDQGKLKYILVGGLEIGTKSYQDDYNVRHVHVCVILHNRTSKRALLHNWKIKEGNGYYLVPRNRDLPYSGWRNHHIKPFSKVDPTKLVLYENGDLPKDLKRKRADASEEEKKLTSDEIFREIRSMIVEDKDDLIIFNRFPRTFTIYGEKIKSTTKQRRITACNEGNPHLWIEGYPGTGKTAILNFIYPKLFKKNLFNKYFDLYDPKEHTHVMLEDLDHEAIKTLSINFVKTLCDEAGFAIDQKYKTPQLARTTVLVSSNFTIRDLVPEGAGYDQNLTAICRRFWQIKIYELLRLLQLKLVPKYQLAVLKKEGNSDMSKVFMDWDYLSDSPTGKELKKPEEYQQIIRDYFFAMTS